MSRLDELIKEYCPEGVEYKRVEEVCKTLTSKLKIKSINYLKDGKYPIIDQGQDFIGGYTNEPKVFPKAEYIIFGDHTCSLKYVNFSFAQGADGIKVIIAKKEMIQSKYLYYCMTNIKLKSNYERHWAKMKKSMIPLPPLPVQEEIVRILDSFTEYKAELQAELQARKKQYEYYRDKLLSFDITDDKCTKLNQLIKEYCPNGVEYKKVGEVCDILDKKRKPIRSSNRQKGNYPYYGANGIQDYVNDYLLDGDYVLVGEDGSVITSSGNPIVTWASGKIWVNNHAHIITCCNKLTLKYIFYCLHIINITDLVHGSIPKLTGFDFKNLQIPLPPLPVQEEIVRILDHFSSLCNDISVGLPAEIEKREKQYEYYRDKLLTFKAINKE